MNVAPGVVAPASTDAVNGGQLFGVSTRLADILGGGARVDPQSGSFSGPNYTIRGSSYGDVGQALSAVDAPLTKDAGAITVVTQQLASLQASSPNGTLIQQPGTGGGVNIGTQVGGGVVNITGTDGARKISGVAAGTATGDAVNVGQLNAAAQILDSKLQDFPVVPTTRAVPQVPLRQARTPTPAATAPAQSAHRASQSVRRPVRPGHPRHRLARTAAPPLIEARRWDPTA